MKRIARNKLREGLLFWLLLYPIAIVLGSLLTALRVTGRIRIRHIERFPRWQGKLIIAANHPSLWEPLVLPILCFRQYLVRPARFIPWSTPDRSNYGDRWYMAALRQRFVSVPRGDRRGQLRALAMMVRVVRRKQVLILFPEGGRTFKGDNFSYSLKGSHMRELKRGLGDLVLKTGATVVPVWVSGSDRVLPNDGSWFPRFWRPTTLTIGTPLYFTRGRNGSKQFVVDQIADSLLRLADDDG